MLHWYEHFSIKAFKMRITRAITKKRFISALLASAFFVILSMMAATPVLGADSTSGYWTDYASTTAPELSGSTYTIENAAQLAWVAVQVNSGDTFEDYTVEISDDITEIDLSAHYWVPIGNESGKYFGGTFTGNNKIISNVKIGEAENPDSLYTDIGLFGCVVSAILKNVNIENFSAYTSTTADTGVLSGVMYSSNATSIHVSGYISMGDSAGSAGGLLGDESNNTIYNCTADVDIDGSTHNNCVGGLIGQSNSTAIMKCYAAGDVTGCLGVGGLVGTASGCSVSYCCTSGSMTCNYVEDSFSYGLIGGLMGEAYNCYISNCYAVGSVSGGLTIGGLIGELRGSSTSYYLKNCYAVGDVSSSNLNCRLGGLVGRNYETTITNGYWNSDAGQTVGGTERDSALKTGVGYGGDTSTPKTAEELKSADFVTLLNNTASVIWASDSALINNGYPLLIRTIPDLTADTTDNTYGSPIEITLDDDPFWRSAITSVEINGTPVTGCVFTLGRLTIPASAFTTTGYLTIVITADGYSDASVIQHIIALTPPALTADITDNRLEFPIELTFTDDAAWRDAVTSVTVSINPVTDYILTSGKLTIPEENFKSSGSYQIVVKAMGYEDTSLSQYIAEVLSTPSLTPDTTNNITGNPADITFADDAAWTNEITSIAVNGTAVADYVLSSGKLTIPADDFLSGPSYYFIEITARGYKDASVTQAMSDECGLLYSFSGTEATVAGYSGNGGSVVIPDIVTVGGTDYTVTAIAKGTELLKSLFENGQTTITSVVIPDSVKTIGDYAFIRCTALTSVTLGSGVEHIGNCAFECCNQITSISIPASVKSYGSYAFAYCTGLESVTFENGLTCIGYSLFEGCSGLTSITIPDSVATIDDYAFSKCINLSSVTMGNGVTSIDAWAFYNCTALKTIMIPDSVTSINFYAFYKCTNLSSAYFFDGKPTFGSDVFKETASDFVLYYRLSQQDSWAGFSHYTSEPFICLTLDGNGGTYNGSAYSLIPTFIDNSKDISGYSYSRTGYTLTGWNTDKDGSGTQYSSGQPIDITEDVILFAQWAGITYTYSAAFSNNADTITCVVSPTQNKVDISLSVTSMKNTSPDSEPLMVCYAIYQAERMVSIEITSVQLTENGITDDAEVQLSGGSQPDRCKIFILDGGNLTPTCSSLSCLFE